MLNPMCSHTDTFREQMERALPCGPMEVMRCTSCGCAIWYRSTARDEVLRITAALEAIAMPSLAKRLLKRNAPITPRQPGNGRHGPNPRWGKDLFG